VICVFLLKLLINLALDLPRATLTLVLEEPLAKILFTLAQVELVLNVLLSPTAPADTVLLIPMLFAQLATSTSSSLPELAPNVPVVSLLPHSPPLALVPEPPILTSAVDPALAKIPSTKELLDALNANPSLTAFLS
jgi:hypothetical protein